MKINWIPTKGEAEILENEIKFRGVAKRTKRGSELPAKFGTPYVKLRSNTYFESGDITAEIQIEKENTKVRNRSPPPTWRQTAFGSVHY